MSREKGGARLKVCPCGGEPLSVPRSLKERGKNGHGHRYRDWSISGLILLAFLTRDNQFYEQIILFFFRKNGIII